jgi:hypothetical protein
VPKEITVVCNYNDLVLIPRRTNTFTLLVGSYNRVFEMGTNTIGVVWHNVRIHLRSVYHSEYTA